MPGLPVHGKRRGRGIVVERPLPRNSSRRWRYLAQRTLTGAWLDRSGIPVLSDTITWDLKTGSFQGTIDPQYYGLTEPGTNQPLMDEWATTIYAECDGNIEWGGLLTVSDFTGPQWNVQATGFRGYPNGQIYDGPNYSQTNIDPLNIVSYLWDYLQSQPNGNLNVELTSNVADSPVKIGTSRTNVPVNVNFPKSGAAVKNKTGFIANVAFSGGTISKILVDGNRVYEKDHKGPGLVWLNPNQTITVDYTGFPSWTWNAWEPIPYTLYWYNGVDIGQEISNIAGALPFDMVEAHNWNADGVTVNHTISLAYPRCGTRKSKLRFVEGENIVILPQLTRDGTQYQNAVMAYGAGSGPSVVHWASGLLDRSKLRRSYAYTNASITNREKLATVARKDAMAKVNQLTAQSVQIYDHPNAPIGSFHEGDDILLQFTSGWMSGQKVWHRVTAYSYSTTTNTLVLSLARSDSFSYQQGDLSTLITAIP